MASSYKTLGTEDVTVTRTPLYENIPITDTMISTDTNVKTFNHGMFQSVYDYTYSLASANHLFDISFGVSTESSSSLGSLYTTGLSKKKNVYRQMSQVLNGYDSNNLIKQFSNDQALQFNHVFFLTFSRLLVKDEVRKGNFELELGVNEDYADPMFKTIKISDANSVVKSGPTGDWAYLYATNGDSSPLHASAVNKIVGVIFYQAGVVALASWVFAKYVVNEEELQTGGVNLHQHKNGVLNTTGYIKLGATSGADGLITFILEKDITHPTNSGEQSLSQALRKRIKAITFHNTTELNSTIYFCRINGNEYNYSANPTFIDENGAIRVKFGPSGAIIGNSTSTYITTVGLYSSDNELLAVGKLSEPIKKTADQSLILRVRLDV